VRSSPPSGGDSEGLISERGRGGRANTLAIARRPLQGALDPLTIDSRGRAGSLELRFPVVIHGGSRVLQSETETLGLYQAPSAAFSRKTADPLRPDRRSDAGSQRGMADARPLGRRLRPEQEEPGCP